MQANCYQHRIGNYLLLVLYQVHFDNWVKMFYDSTSFLPVSCSWLHLANSKYPERSSKYRYKVPLLQLANFCLQSNIFSSGSNC